MKAEYYGQSPFFSSVATIFKTGAAKNQAHKLNQIISLHMA